MIDLIGTVRLIKERFSAQNFSEISWVVIGQILNVLLNFLIIKQLASLGTESYGIYALILTINLLMGSLLYGPATQAFTRFYYHYRDKGEISLFIRLMYKFIWLSAVLILFIGIIALSSFYLIDSEFSIVIILMSTLFIVSFKTNEFFSISLNIIRMRKQNSLLQNLERILNLTILWLFFSYGLLNLTSVLIIFFGTSFLLMVIKFRIFHNLHKSLLIINNDNPSDNRIEIKKTLLNYAFPFILWGITGWLQSNGEKWIIANYLSTSDVGIYAVMMTLVSALIILPNNIISEFSTPIIFQHFSDLQNSERVKSGHALINLIVGLTIVFTAIASFITYFFAKDLIVLISSSAFVLYWYLLPMFCIGTGLFYTGQAMCNTGMALNLPQKYLVPKILAGVLSVFLNIVFIIYFGLNGIAYSMVIIGAVYSFYILLINKKLTREFSE
jgi:O-antigen/teichoic acid export membrane protein